MKNLKVIFCGYRDWAKRAYSQLDEDFPNISIDLAQDTLSLNALLKNSKYDFGILAGWSWKIKKDVLKDNDFFGIHPSDLPEYAGGSPLQHQIIEGIEESKCTLFKITPELDKGGTVCKVPLSLKGNMDKILIRLSDCTIQLVTNVITDYPNVNIVEQQKGGAVRKRRTSNQSRIDLSEFSNGDFKKIYNIIRALGDPYPNAYIENDQGQKLIFKNVEFNEGKHGED